MNEQKNTFLSQKQAFAPIFRETCVWMDIVVKFPNYLL